MGRYRNFVVREFRGLNEDENPDSLGADELSVAENTWKHGRAIGTRPGLERDSEYDAAIASGKCIHGLYEFRSGFDANRDFVAMCGGVIHTSDTVTVGSGAATISDPGSGTGAAGTNMWTFANHKNTLFAAGGADGDSIWSWDGSAGAVSVVTFQNAAAGAIDAKYIFEKWNFLFLAGMNGTAIEDNPTVVRYSAIGDGTTWPVGNTFGGTSAIGGISSFGDEYATGFGDYTDNRGDWMLFLTNKQIYPVTFTGIGGSPFRVESGIANGCVSQRAFATLGIDSGDAVYLSQYGIHSLRQSQQFGGKQESYLSWKIRPTFARLNFSRLRQAVAKYWPEEGIVLFGVPTGTNTFNDTILCLDVKAQEELTASTARWYVWRLAGSFNANVMELVRDGTTGKRYLYIGDTAGNVLRFNRDVFTDVGTGYTVRFVTKHSDFDAPGRSKGVGDTWVGLQPGGDYAPALRYVFDYGRRVSSPKPMRFPAVTNAKWNQVKWDQFQWGSQYQTYRIKVFGTGQGDTVAHEFSHSGAGEPFRVTTLTSDMRVAGETTGTTGD